MNRLGYAREASVWRTAICSARTRTPPGRVVVYPNVHLGLRGRTSIKCRGRLLLGRRFNVGRYLESELKLVGDDACFDVEGAFSIFTGFSISVNPGASLKLGSGYINSRCVIDCFDEISIGHDVAISKGVVVRDSDNHTIIDGRPISAPIRIGDHVWIGLNAVILKGVTLGNGAVVAAGAVVTHDVPARTIVGGVPARILRQNVDWQ
jgi:hypothetical protein